MRDDRGQPNACRREAANDRRWLVIRLYPLLAMAGLLVIGMGSSTTWGPHMAGKTAWALPHDLWGTLVAASRLLHLQLGALYTRPTGLVSFPGAAVILVPVAAVIDAVGLSLRIPGPHNSQPGAWLLAGPYAIAASSAVLFAADAIAERLGVSRARRALLAASEAVALWNVSVEWGHPEDAVAVALLMYSMLALSDARAERSAWLAGAAIAVQPLVLLALPFVAVIIEPRKLAGYLGRAAAPGVVAIGVAAAANWGATFAAMTSQPNWPAIDHPTPWIALAVHLSGGAVAAGPARAAAIAVACCCAFAVGRRWRAEGVTVPWNAVTIAELLWWAAFALALRTAFEPVMVAYYIWPVLAVALITATSTWPRLIVTAAAASALTAFSQVSWHGPWAWWSVIVAGLALTLGFARTRLSAGSLPVRSAESIPAVRPEFGDAG
jgi:hypothetical protein